MSLPGPIPITPPSIYTDARVPDPDDMWKVYLRKRIEHHLLQDVRMSRDPSLALSTHPSKNNHSRVQHDFERSMNRTRALAEEEFNRRSYSETSDYKRVLDVVSSILPDIVRRELWILDNNPKVDEERIPFAPLNASQNDEDISTGPQRPVVTSTQPLATAQRKVAEAKCMEEEAKKRETVIQRKVDEARRRELEARRKEEIAKLNEEVARKQEEEDRRKEQDARRREGDAQKRMEDARRRESLARQREEGRRFEEKMLKEDEARRKEDAVRRRNELSTVAVAIEEECQPRPMQEKGTQALGSSRYERWVAREADDAARLEPTKAADTANRPVEGESATSQRKNQSNAQARVWQRARASEEQRRKQLEEQHRLNEQLYLEEQGRQDAEEEQIRLDEEQEREREEQIRFEEERETNHLTSRKDQLRLSEEERFRILQEQHRKVVEQNRQRDQAEHQQWQQRVILGQRTKDEQQEFRKKLAEHYRRTTERNNTGAAFGASAPHRPAGPTNARAGNRAGVLSKPKPTVPNIGQRVPAPYTSAPPKSEEEWVKAGGNRGNPRAVTKRVPLVGSKLEEEKWARRTEERVRLQQKQFEREQERLESERTATKSGGDCGVTSGSRRLLQRFTARK